MVFDSRHLNIIIFEATEAQGDRRESSVKPPPPKSFPSTDKKVNFEMNDIHLKTNSLSLFQGSDQTRLSSLWTPITNYSQVEPLLKHSFC